MSKPKAAWILCSNRWNSAITEYALSTGRSLRLQGWTVFYSALSQSPGEARARSYDLPGDSFASFGLGEVLKLKRLQQKILPSVVFLFGGPETFLARFLRGVPCVRFRGQDKDMSETLSGWKNQLNMNHCEAVLVPSKVLAQCFEGILTKPVLSVTLGVDEKKFFYAADALLSSTRPTLRIIGRLDPIKGHQSFLEIYQNLLKQWPAGRPKPWLEIIGQPANISEQQLRDTAKLLGLIEGEDWQLRNERIADLGKVMAATHIGVISSLGSEVICRVAEEFLLSGAPIFASGVGSLQECLIHESFGVSYLGLNRNEAASLLLYQLWNAFEEKDQDRQQRALESRKHFSLESMGRALEKSLKDLL